MAATVMTTSDVSWEGEVDPAVSEVEIRTGEARGGATVPVADHLP